VTQTAPEAQAPANQGPAEIEPIELLDMYRRMIRIRRFEEKLAALFKRGKLPGFVHLYIGEEAVAVGMCSALRADDRITSTHRGHGHLIAKGAQVDRMMAELFGQRRRLLPRQGRLDAHRRLQPRHHRHERHRRAADPDRHRLRLGRPATGPRQRHRSRSSATAPPTRACSSRP
jgi:hypothetical protein